MAASSEIPSNIRKAVDETLSSIKKHKVNTAPGLIKFLATLIWSLGCSIDNIPPEEATKENIRKQYLLKPTLGNALANLGIDLNEEWLHAAELQGETTDQN